MIHSSGRIDSGSDLKWNFVCIRNIVLVNLKFSNLKKLKEEYGNDERVVRLVAISMLKILSKKPELRDNNIIQYAFDKAERSFYDAVLSSYVLGLLILLKTGTKQEDILDMGLKTSNMSPGILRTVLDSLPEEVYHKEVKQKLKAHLELV